MEKIDSRPDSNGTMSSETDASPSVSVCIVSYNVRQYLLQTLKSLRQSDYRGTLEIIVVDNNSFDGSVTTIREQFPDVKVISNRENLGFGKAVNQAVEQAQGTYVFILNPDTIVQEKSIQVLSDYLETHPDVGMIGPKIVNADGSLQLSCKRSFPTVSVALPKVLGFTRLFPQSRWAGRYNLTYLDENEIHSVDAISGSSMFVRRSVFEEVNGFDDQFFMFGEDLDLCYRIKQAGHEIHYVPETTIVHYQGESVKTAPFDSLNAFYQAMILFTDKHFSRSQSLLARTVIRLGIRLRRTLSLIAEWRSQIFSVILDGLAVLTAFMVAIPIRFDDYEPITTSQGLVPGIYVIAWIAVGAMFQLYSRYILSYSRAILSSITGFFLAVAFTYFFKQYAFSRLVIIVASALITLMIPGWRVFVHFLMSRGVLGQVKDRHHILFTRKTLVIGADEEGIRIARSLLKRFDTGLDIVGFADDELRQDQEVLPVPFLGKLQDLRSLIHTWHIREIIFSTAKFRYEDILTIMDETKDLHLTYRMVPQREEILLGKASVDEIGDFSFMNIEYPLFHRLHRLSKRLFDIVVSGIMLILFSPLLLVLRFIKPYQPVSFWTENGEVIDTRIYPSRSRFLQEVPLLWSIFLGKMSFVGAALVDTSEADPGLICQPGLTGLERVRSVKFAPGDRKVLHHYYVQNQSLSLDLEIIVKTLFSNG